MVDVVFLWAFFATGPLLRAAQAAKGVALVFLSCFHSTSHTPSVSLAGSEVPSSLPAPPTGEPSGLLRIRPGFYKAMGAYRETPQAGPLGLPAPLSGALFLLPPLGVVLRAANQDSNDCRWQSYLCFVPRSGKGGVVGIFEPLPFIERHPLSQALTGCQLPHRGAKGTYSPVPMRILARAELASRMTVFSVPVRLFFRASRARVNS